MEVVFATKICGQTIPASGQLMVLMQAARRRFASTAKKAAGLEMNVVRELLEVLLRSAEEEDARLGLVLGLTVYAGARWDDVNECTFEECFIIPGKGLRASPRKRKNIQPGDEKKVKPVRELYVAQGPFVAMAKEARGRFGWYTGPLPGCCYSTFVAGLR